MNSLEHFKALEKMYLAAPINRRYETQIKIEKGVAEIIFLIKKEFFHSGGAVHGSEYFKALDDAAFFAANSLESNVFVVTTSFTIYMTRPVSTGSIKAIGRVVNKNNSQFISEAVAYNSQGREIARGSGIFVRSATPLDSVLGYRES